MSDGGYSAAAATSERPVYEGLSLSEARSSGWLLGLNQKNVQKTHW